MTPLEYRRGSKPVRARVVRVRCKRSQEEVAPEPGGGGAGGEQGFLWPLEARASSVVLLVLRLQLDYNGDTRGHNLTFTRSQTHLQYVPNLSTRRCPSACALRSECSLRPPRNASEPAPHALLALIRASMAGMCLKHCAVVLPGTASAMSTHLRAFHSPSAARAA